MGNLSISASYKAKNRKAEAVLSLFSFEEGKTFIVYSPALDLSGYGKNEVEARNSFGIALEEFMRYTINKNSILVELERLGWKIKGGKKHPKIISPDFSTLLNENKELAKLIDKKDFRKFNQKIEIPEFA